MSLAGKVVLVTRAPEAAAGLAARLRAQGASAIEAPTIEVEGPVAGGPLDSAVLDAARGGFAWSAFTSASGVAAWRSRAEALGLGPGDLRARIAAVGEGTARALRSWGVSVDLVPEAFTTAALGTAFPEGSGRVVLPRADRATPRLPEALAAKGWTPVEVAAYRTRRPDALPQEAVDALREGRVDAVAFTSPSTVEGFTELTGWVDGPAVVCIGPVTAEAARAAGLPVSAVADPHTIEGLVEALEAALR